MANENRSVKLCKGVVYAFILKSRTGSISLVLTGVAVHFDRMAACLTCDVD